MLAEALAPLFVYTLLGLILRVAGIVKGELAATLFRFMFVCTLPALVFTAISRAPLGSESILLPVAGFTTNAVCALSAFAWGRFRGLEERDAGALVLSASVINMMLMFPFVLFILGEDGLRDAILFDIGNAVYVSTIASSLALYFGHEGDVNPLRSVIEMFKAPIFLALFAALIVNIGDLELAPLVYDITERLGDVTMPLTMVALGIALSAKALKGSLPVAPIALRMGLGLVLGVLLSTLLGMEGLTRWVVIAGAAAPIGFGTVALAAVGKLDVERTATAVTLSVALGLFTITGLLWLARQVTGL
jgi:predicted permease